MNRKMKQQRSADNDKTTQIREGGGGARWAQHVRLRVARRLRVPMLTLAAACAAMVSAQPSRVGSSLKGFQMVQRVDDVLYGVDSVSLQILDPRHVRGTFVRVSVEKPTPILGYSRFVADCRAPIRISLVSSSNLNGKTHPDGSPQYVEARAEPRPPEQMQYSSGDLLDGTRMVAEFACRATTQPGAAEKIADELYERGGPPDTVTIACDLLPDGGGRPVIGVEVRYSASAQAVAVNHQWLSSGIVKKNTIQFGSGRDKWTIDLRSMRAQLKRPDGDVRYSGACRR